MANSDDEVIYVIYTDHLKTRNATALKVNDDAPELKQKTETIQVCFRIPSFIEQLNLNFSVGAYL